MRRTLRCRPCTDSDRTTASTSASCSRAATSRPTTRSRSRWSTSSTSSATARPARRSRSIPRTACASSSTSSAPTACASPTCSSRTTTPITSAVTSAAGRSKALAELLALDDVTVKVHVQAEEAFGVKRVTGASDSDLVLHASGDIVHGRRGADHADPHAGPHARFAVLLRRRPARRGRHAVPRRLRAHRPARRRSRPRSTRASRRSSRSCPTTRCCSRATCTRPRRRRRWARCAGTTTCSGRAHASSG